MGYVIEITENVALTIKRKIEVNSLLGINIHNIKQLNLTVDGNVCNQHEYISDVAYGEHLNKYKFVNGLFAVKVSNAEQAEYLINLATENGIKNEGEYCITKDAYQTAPYYYVHPNPDNYYAMAQDDYILIVESNEYDIESDFIEEVAEFEDVFEIV